jgi:hypothetical protein
MASYIGRRKFLATLGGAAVAWPLAARAQQAPGRPLIGVLSPLSPAAATRNIEALRAGLRDLGYVEDRNVTLALRFAGGVPARLPELAAELVALKPDVILAGSIGGYPGRAQRHASNSAHHDGDIRGPGRPGACQQHHAARWQYHGDLDVR